jgi:hypothetical protein
MSLERESLPDVIFLLTRGARDTPDTKFLAPCERAADHVSRKPFSYNVGSNEKWRGIKGVVPAIKTTMTPADLKKDDTINKALGSPLRYEGYPRSQKQWEGEVAELFRNFVRVEMGAKMSGDVIPALAGILEKGLEQFLTVLPQSLTVGRIDNSPNFVNEDRFPLHFQDVSWQRISTRVTNWGNPAWRNARDASAGLAGKTYIAAFLFFSAEKHWVSCVFDRHAGVLVVFDSYGERRRNRARAASIYWREYWMLLGYPYEFHTIAMCSHEQSAAWECGYASFHALCVAFKLEGRRTCQVAKMKQLPRDAAAIHDTDHNDALPKKSLRSKVPFQDCGVLVGPHVYLSTVRSNFCLMAAIEIGSAGFNVTIERETFSTDTLSKAIASCFSNGEEGMMGHDLRRSVKGTLPTFCSAMNADRTGFIKNLPEGIRAHLGLLSKDELEARARRLASRAMSVESSRPCSSSGSRPGSSSGPAISSSESRDSLFRQVSGRLQSPILLSDAEDSRLSHERDPAVAKPDDTPRASRLQQQPGQPSSHKRDSAVVRPDDTLKASRHQQPSGHPSPHKRNLSCASASDETPRSSKLRKEIENLDLIGNRGPLFGKAPVTPPPRISWLPVEQLIGKREPLGQFVFWKIPADWPVAFPSNTEL